MLCGPVAVICFAEKETKASGEGSEAAPVWSVGTVTAPTRITITNQQLIHSVTDIFTKRLSPLGKCRDPGMWGTQQAFWSQQRPLRVVHPSGPVVVIIHRALMTLAVSPILCFSREAARSCRRLRASVFLLPARKSQVSVQSRAAPGVAEALGSMPGQHPGTAHLGNRCAVCQPLPRGRGWDGGSQFWGHGPAHTPRGSGNIQDILMLKSDSLFT